METEKAVEKSGDPVRSDYQNALSVLFQLRKHLSEEEVLRFFDFAGASLPGVNLRNADLRKMIFDGADISGAYLEKCNAHEASFRAADLQGANLSGAELQGANLSGAELQGANLSGAQLQGADLNGAQLQGANLGGAKLQRANLGSAQLQGAILSVASLQGADLRDADLRGTNLIGAKLQGAVFSEAHFDATTSLTKVNFQGAAVRLVDFTNIPQITYHLDDLFGDTSVTLPDGMTAPDHWFSGKSDPEKFYLQWRTWQATLPSDWDA